MTTWHNVYWEICQYISPSYQIISFLRLFVFFTQLCGPVCFICSVPMDTASACRELLFWEDMREGTGTAVSEDYHRLRSKQSLQSINIFTKYRGMKLLQKFFMSFENWIDYNKTAFSLWSGIKTYWINLCSPPGFLKGPCSMFWSFWRIFHAGSKEYYVHNSNSRDEGVTLFWALW